MEILATDSNSRGDLFGRLVTDVFHALGYTESRLNIHKTGREIDVTARHRVEMRKAVAECKAVSKPIGGAALNKFAGLLQLERDGASDISVEGYFLSLSGFTESALEQESEAGKPRFVLLTGRDVEEQLVVGGAVVGPDFAQATAAQLLPPRKKLELEGTPRLIAHDVGWVWLLTYGRNHEVSHFALIHADGRPLAQSLANAVIATDSKLDGPLQHWLYLAPSTGPTKAQREHAGQLYRGYLLSELGEITLEGLPADEEAGEKRIALEDIYVPLRLKSIDSRPAQSEERSSPDVGKKQDDNDDDDQRGEGIGDVLSRESRLAILADPGSGKSTLIKRLAVAYIDEEHRAKIADDLPRQDWLPLFIRCRSLGDSAAQPIRSILSQIPERGEFAEHSVAFNDLVASQLRSGKVVLLIDGLDEIADPQARLRFALQLRTFLATYPNVALVITSRKAGFRVVGGAISNICGWYSIADFSNDDIRTLTHAWHATVFLKSAKTEHEATELAHTIIRTDRVRRLARNPLLLTTLLLVKRWVGDLPRRRSILYEKAIEVLLMTWNVEAHEPIEREEAIPQLAFVAYSMTNNGRQRINSKELIELLQDAREQMPDILGFSRISVKQFVDRIESRSSLLIMTGHEEVGGDLLPVYEFRHLTFQEYLTAVALVDGFYDGHRDTDRLVDQLEPHLEAPEWFEVIALANVRAGRSAWVVIKRILELVETIDASATGSQLGGLLGRCLADEVQMAPELVHETAHSFAQIYREQARYAGLVGEILEGRYGEVVREAAEEGFAGGGDDYPEFAGICAEISRITGSRAEQSHVGSRKWASIALEGNDDAEATRAALWVMYEAFGRWGSRVTQDQGADFLKALVPDLFRWCEHGEPYVAYAASWALVWCGSIGVIPAEDAKGGLRALLRLWQQPGPGEAQKMAAWAFSEMPMLPRELVSFGGSTKALAKFALDQFETESSASSREDRRAAALILGFYIKAPWSEAGLRRILNSDETVDRAPASRSLKQALGIVS